MRKADPVKVFGDRIADNRRGACRAHPEPPVCVPAR